MQALSCHGASRQRPVWQHPVLCRLPVHGTHLAACCLPQLCSKPAGKRLEESKKINQSLSALGNVIAALTDTKGTRSHIPYRWGHSAPPQCRLTCTAVSSWRRAAPAPWCSPTSIPVHLRTWVWWPTTCAMLKGLLLPLAAGTAS